MNYNLNQISMTVTVLWDGNYWMALFEKREFEGYSVAKATISVNEPQGYHIEKFLKHLDRAKLQFTPFGPEPTTAKAVTKPLVKVNNFKMYFLSPCFMACNKIALSDMRIN